MSCYLEHCRGRWECRITVGNDTRGRQVHRSARAIALGKLPLLYRGEPRKSTVTVLDVRPPPLPSS